MPLIDFITVSRTPPQVAELRHSIALSMGQAYSHELTVIDGNQFDLFTGYNAGAAQTTAEYLAFVHDDARLLSNSLAFSLPVHLLQDPATGFIGVAGSRLLGANGAWWGGEITREQTFQNCRGMVLHTAQNELGVYALVWPGATAEFGRVVVVDGVLLMCHRRTFNRLGGFDAATFQGFHFYDVDITFRAHQLGLKNFVAPLSLLHGSLGNYDAAWEKNRAIFVEKHKAALPCVL